jgi:hypothetical protein
MNSGGSQHNNFLAELEEFLREANLNSYANPDAPKAASARPGSEDYHFEKGEWAYHDTYFGGRDFIGEEIIYKNGDPVWGANYFGFIIHPGSDPKEVYGFLREALRQEERLPGGLDIPVRGPSEYKSGEWTYSFYASDSLEKFSGAETIVRNGILLYRCFVHGGLIK